MTKGTQRWTVILCLVVLVGLASQASAAPVHLQKYEFIVAGQEASTGDFAVPAGKNRMIVVTVHARTDTGPTSDYVTVDWARLDGDPAQPFTKARQAIRSVAPMHQSTTLLYRHLIDNSFVGNASVTIRMENNLVEDKIVVVQIMANIDSSYTPGVGDGNGNQAASVGIQAITSLAANTDFLVIDSATHNSGAGATVTGRGPTGKIWSQVNNTSPVFKALDGYHVKTASSSVNYSYTMSAASDWSIVAVRFRAAYTIQASTGPNGTIDPVGDVPVISGGSQAFNITADANYVIAQLLVDGVPVPAAAGQETFTYAFTNVTTDHTITAQFSGRPILTVDPAAEDFECTTVGYTAAMAMAGVSAIDPEDGDITASVVISNVSLPLLQPGVYTILYNVSDSDNTPASQQQRVVTIADTLPPEMALNGQAEVVLECGSDTYTELGAQAYDQCDGALDVDISGDEVDELATGTYGIEYYAEDAAGFDVSLARTVHVVDTTGPVIYLLATNPVILDGGASYVEAGATAWDACEGDIPADTIIINNESVNSSVIGSYPVYYTASDSVGNCNTAILTVLVQREACALLIDANATDITARPGDPVTLAVEQKPGFCAVGVVNYEWLKRNGAKSGGFSPVPGAPNAPVFTINEVDEEDEGVYRCDVSDDMYTVSSPEISLMVGTGIPVASGMGIAVIAGVTVLLGATILRKRNK